MFTCKGLKSKDIKAPPVKGCRCTYCHKMRIEGYAIDGHGSMPSHRLEGGNEAHNPENKARLLLKQLVSPAQFKRYTSRPGGDALVWQGKSKLWYASGRVYSDAGHYVLVYKDKARTEEIAKLCVPLGEEGIKIPLADIVMGHYLACTADEKSIWAAAAVSIYEPEAIPARVWKPRRR